MPDPELPLYVPTSPLTPRQDRIEATIERVLRAGGTRSELRDAVHQFADLARMQQTPPERALAKLKTVAARAGLPMTVSEVYVGDPADLRALMVRWCVTRYYRVD